MFDEEFVIDLEPSQYRQYSTAHGGAMNARFLILGALAGGVVIFFWGAVTHAALPQPLHYFTDEPLLIEAIRAHTTGNGVYLASRGVFASVAFRPDFADKAQNLAPNLII